MTQILTIVVGLVIENNPGASKLKIVEAGGNSTAENLMAAKLIEIVESEPTFSVSKNNSMTGCLLLSRGMKKMKRG